MPPGFQFGKTRHPVHKTFPCVGPEILVAWKKKGNWLPDWGQVGVPGSDRWRSSGGWEGAGVGKGGQEEKAAHAPGLLGAGRLISAEGGIRSERQVRAPSPQRATPPGGKLENAILSTGHNYSKGRSICLGSEGKEKTKRKRSCSQNSKPQQLTVGLGPEAAVLREEKSQNLVERHLSVTGAHQKRALKDKAWPFTSFTNKFLRHLSLKSKTTKRTRG